MASNPNLAKIGGGKKNVTQGSSPMSQRSLDDMLQRECSNPLKELQAMMQAIQEVMMKNHEEIKTELEVVRNVTGEMREKIQAMDGRFEAFQQQIAKNEQKLLAVEQRLDNEEKKVEEMDKNLTEANKELMTAVTLLEAEKATQYLRFQNVIEERGEDLPDKMAGLLAGALEIDKEEMIAGMDETYRVQTNYGRRHNLPREVHVKFIKKKIRDELLYRTRDEQLEYGGKQIIVLKQIPKRMRDLQKNYLFLTSRLHQSNVNFRWLTPEGLIVTWQEKKFRLDTVEKVEDFYRQYCASEEDLRDLGEERVVVEKRRDIERMLEKRGTEQSMEEVRGGRGQDRLEQQGRSSEEAKEIRITRSTKTQQKQDNGRGV